MDVVKRLYADLGFFHSQLLPQFKELLGTVIEGCQIRHNGAIVQIDCPSKMAARAVKDTYIELVTNGQNSFLFPPSVQLRWPGGIREIPTAKIIAIASDSNEDNNILSTNNLTDIFTSLNHLPRPLLDKLVEIAEDERPCCLIRVRDKKQVAVNQKMIEQLETPGDECVERIMTAYWRPSDARSC